ncbi:MAG: GTP 3',8-cyclase MoaA [Defluviitaleaceae bacterium]|nr:GTP 3',8-cyclase MoaA [Defluviitaleaceae bacterium]
MKDSFARKIDYMRVSITDRCNLRCVYCMPEDVDSIGHEKVLRFEELLRLCSIMAELGVKYIRITGGEPLARKGWLDFVRELKAISGVEAVTLTTNAVLLEPYLEELAKIGVNSLNISLDTLCRETYRKLTGMDAFDAVWSGISKAVQMGFRIKLNCVPIKGVNDDQILQMAALPQTMPLDMRFIELMPTGAGAGLEGIPTDDIVELVTQKYPELVTDGRIHGFGPAKYLKSKDMKGGLGFISALSHAFCDKCNRIRVSSDGKLILCLHHTKGLDLRSLLRSGATDGEIKEAIVESVKNKPERHHLDTEVNLEHMSKIGG